MFTDFTALTRNFMHRLGFTGVRPTVEKAGATGQLMSLQAVSFAYIGGVLDIIQPSLLPVPDHLMLISIDQINAELLNSSKRASGLRSAFRHRNCLEHGSKSDDVGNSLLPPSKSLKARLCVFSGKRNRQGCLCNKNHVSIGYSFRCR
jgi:hypothetical protein